MIGPSARPRRRPGFTLVELLVVMTIIALLMGLLLPAVMNAQESGRRVRCTSSLTQIALATVRTGEKAGFIPGWRNRSPRAADSSGGTFNNTVSWPIMILPSMERNDIYSALASGTSPTPPYIAFFVCPSSPPDAQTQPTLSYAGNCGSASNARMWDGVMNDTTISSGANAARIALADVANADGTATTMLLSERCGPGNAKANQPLFQTWWDRRNLPATAFTFANSSSYGAYGNAPVPGIGLANAAPGTMKVINNIANNAQPGFWSQPSSNHPGGVVTAFCDGHVEFVRDSIAGNIYAQLLTADHNLSSTVAKTTWDTNGYPILNEKDYSSK